jgi:hypothetical protein
LNRGDRLVGCAIGGREPTLEVEPESGQVVGVAADDGRSGPFEVSQRAIAAVGFGRAGESVLADQLDHRSQRVWRVQAEGTQQRRVRHRDRRDAQVRDSHLFLSRRRAVSPRPCRPGRDDTLGGQ